jgi:DUF1009 family protein
VHGAEIGFSLKLVEFAAKLLFMKNRYDGVLRLVIREFEKNGMAVIGVQDLLPQLLAPRGALTRAEPTPDDMAQVNACLAAARKFASSDKGQSAALLDGRIAATERWEGTDSLIHGSQRGSILLKIAKPGQDMRADVPSIGPHTVAALVDAGFRGAAIEAGKSIIENKRETVAAANRAGIWIVGI